MTHAVEVHKSGKVKRVLCGTVKPKDVAPLRLYTVPTCCKCVHIDAQPVTCPVNANRWFNLEMRRIGADPVDRARIAADGRARAAPRR